MVAPAFESKGNIGRTPVHYNKKELENFADSIVESYYQFNSKDGPFWDNISKYVVSYMIDRGRGSDNNFGGRAVPLRGPGGRYYTNYLEEVVDLAHRTVKMIYIANPRDGREYIYPRYGPKALSWQWDRGFDYVNLQQKEWPTVFFARVLGYTTPIDQNMFLLGMSDATSDLADDFGYGAPEQEFLWKLSKEIEAMRDGGFS